MKTIYSYRKWFWSFRNTEKLENLELKQKEIEYFIQIEQGLHKSELEVQKSASNSYSHYETSSTLSLTISSSMGRKHIS